jgi:uncharacterized protein YoxC
MIRVIFLAALLCATSLTTAADKEKDGVKTKETGGSGVAQILTTVERILRGGKVADEDLKSLDKAVIRLETGGPEASISMERGVEGEPKERLNIQRNLYILRFDTDGANERRLRVLQFQRKILKNQLALLKALNVIAKHQVRLASRTARVENKMRDMTLGMKVSSKEMDRVRGETASTGAKVSDIAYTTSEMMETLDEMAKSIDDVESAIEGVDIEIGDLSKSIESTTFDISRGMKDLGGKIEDRE